MATYVKDLVIRVAVEVARWLISVFEDKQQKQKRRNSDGSDGNENQG